MNTQNSNHSSAFTCLASHVSHLMSKISLLIFLFPFSLIAGDAVISMKYTDAKIPAAKVELKWFLTDELCKMQMMYAYENQNTTTVFLPNTEKNSLLMYDVKADEKSKYLFTLPLETLKGDTRFAFNRSKVKEGKEEKTIAGVSCKKVTLTTDRFVAEFWLAKSLPDGGKWMNFFRSYPELAAIADAELQGFPLASVIKDLSGNVIASFETTSVQQSPISKNEFTVPAGYRSIEDARKEK